MQGWVPVQIKRGAHQYVVAHRQVLDPWILCGVCYRSYPTKLTQVSPAGSNMMNKGMPVFRHRTCSFVISKHNRTSQIIFMAVSVDGASITITRSPHSKHTYHMASAGSLKPAAQH